MNHFEQQRLIEIKLNSYKAQLKHHEPIYTRAHLRRKYLRSIVSKLEQELSWHKKKQPDFEDTLTPNEKRSRDIIRGCYE